MRPTRRAASTGAAGKVLALVRLNLTRIRRDRVFMFSMFVLPVLVIFVVGTASGSTVDRLPVGVVAEDDGPAARELAARVSSAPGLRIRSYESVSDLRRAVRGDEVLAGVVIPRGFTQAVDGGGTVKVPLFTNPASGPAVAARTSVVSAVTGQASVVQAARFAAAKSGAPTATAMETARRLAQEQPTVAVDEEAVGSTGTPRGFGYAGPAALLLFMFITSVTAAAHVVESRRLGVTQRAAATPTPAAVLVAGEACSRLAITLVQAAFVVVASAFAFGVQWGDPLTTAAVIGLFGVICTAVAMALGSVVRTFEQAVVFGPPLGIALAMVGGCVWPMELVSRPLAAAGWLTPHRWALDALVQGAAQDGLAAAARPLAVLAVGAATALPVAVMLFRRRALTLPLA